MSGGGTPRQQMIGLMYLVLLAMLAMNASKDLLNAFVMLERGIDKIVVNFNDKNDKYYAQISGAAAKMPSLKKHEEMALKIKSKADELFKFIQESKDELVKVSGGRGEDSIPLGKDNQDLGMTHFIVTDGGKRGEDLKKLVDEYRGLIVSTLKDDGFADNDYLIEEYEHLLGTADKPDPHDKNIMMSWIYQMTDHLPLASVTANLSLWQSYVRSAEADVVGSIAGSLDGDGIVVNKLEGMVAFDAGYVLKSDSVKANIFMSAYNSNVTPIIFLGIPDTAKFDKDLRFLDPTGNGTPPIIGEAQKLDAVNGKGKFGVRAESVGEQTLQGVIGTPTKKGVEYRYFRSKYMVAEPQATVAASKMNVLYVGVPNPMEISAPGVPADEISPSASGISFRPDTKKGAFIATATVENPKGTEIVVKKKDGTVLGKSVFRVKRLPDPVASILGQKEGLVSKGKLSAASFLKAEMENFDFDTKVDVVSFKMTVSMGGDLQELNQNSGATLTAQMKNLLNSVRVGNRIYFEDIKVKMPDGSVRKVPSIILKVQ